jgi:crossover junction endodeoxyribonuclease RuvC
VIALGIDPGTAATGYGVVSDDGGAARRSEPLLRAGSGTLRLVECGVIRTRARDTLAARLLDIFEGVQDLIARHCPDRVAVEGVFYARNVRSTVVLGHARGVVLLAAQKAGVRIAEFPPAEIKKAVVGNGAATKEQVQFMIARLLRLREPPSPSDAADGVAAALTCLLTARFDALRSATNGAARVARVRRSGAKPAARAGRPR